MDPNSGIKTTDDDCVSNNNNENSLQASKVSKENNQASKLHSLGTRIPVRTHKRLLQFALINFGKINGAVSLIVADAIDSYIDKQQQTTSFAISLSKPGKPRADKMEKLRQISMKLKQLTSYPEINPFTIVNTIKDVLGPCDKRTLNNYLKIIKTHSKENFTSSGVGSIIDVTTFVEKIQRDNW